MKYLGNIEKKSVEKLLLLLTKAMRDASSLNIKKYFWSIKKNVAGVTLHSCQSIKAEL
jgi:hypothetical protein